MGESTTVIGSAPPTTGSVTIPAMRSLTGSAVMTTQAPMMMYSSPYAAGSVQIPGSRGGSVQIPGSRGGSAVFSSVQPVYTMMPQTYAAPQMTMVMASEPVATNMA